MCDPPQNNFLYKVGSWLLEYRRTTCRRADIDVLPFILIKSPVVAKSQPSASGRRRVEAALRLSRRVPFVARLNLTDRANSDLLVRGFNNMGSEAEAKSSQGHAKWVSMIMVILCICGTGMVFLSTQLEDRPDFPAPSATDASAEPNILLQPKPAPRKAFTEQPKRPQGDSVAALAKLEVENRAAVQAIKSRGTVMETDPEAIKVAQVPIMVCGSRP